MMRLKSVLSALRCSFTALMSVVLVVTVAALVSGFDPASAVRLGMLLAIVAVPGIVLVDQNFSANQERRGTPQSVLFLGVPLGLVAAVLSQQLFIGLGLMSFGWLIPSLVTVTRLRRIQPVLRSNVGEIREDAILLGLVALLVLSDTNWGFLVGAGMTALSLHVKGPLRYVLIAVGVLLTRLVVDPLWYLISDDRLFEEAYSFFIHHFGFWSWYGSSNTWVPYHWFAHGVGGLVQAMVGGEKFQAVGAGVQVINALLVGTASLSIVKVLIDRRSLVRIAAIAIPFAGVFALGESNSADLSIGLGLWLIAFVLELSRASFKRSIAVPVFIVGLSAVMLAKVSTGLVIGVSLAVYFFVLHVSEKESKRWLHLAAISLVTVIVVLILNYDILGFSGLDDSRTRYVFTLGGSLGVQSYPVPIRLVASLGVLLAGLALPLLLLFNRTDKSDTARPLVLLSLFLLLIGWSVRVFVRSYNNESFVEAAILCSIPLLLAVIVRNTESISKTLVVFSGFAGALLGVIQQRFLQAESGSTVGGAMRILGQGPLVVGIVVIGIGIVLWRKNVVQPEGLRLSRVLSLSAILLLATLGGGDANRIVQQVTQSSVWAETNFGQSDQFFVGSPDEQNAALWLIKNSDMTDIVGTNRICPINIDCQFSGQSAIAAWTNRRTYIEAERFIVGRRVDEVPVGAQSIAGHPNWVSDRKSKMISFGVLQDEERFKTLQNAGVDWFWLDLRFGKLSSSAERQVVYRSTSIVILRIPVLR
jgi:hypothetical protein